jgi:hypothetical protein
MAALNDWQLERYCQARAVSGSPVDSAPGRDHNTALAYAIGIIAHASATQKAHLAQKILSFRLDVETRLQELGGPPDTLFKGL